MDYLINIILGISASIIASFVFWLFSFRISRTKVIFSKNIEKSKNTGEYPGKNRYRIMMLNSGKRDLIEVSFMVKISINREGTTNYTYLKLGNDNRLPVMYGKAHQFKNLESRCAHKLTIRFSPTGLTEFKKNFYAKSIQDKAKTGKLSLDDIFNEYGENVSLTIFTYGNDSLTGARRMFCSPDYDISSVKNGIYKMKMLKDYNIAYKLYVKDILQIDTQENLIAEIPSPDLPAIEKNKKLDNGDFKKPD